MHYLKHLYLVTNDRLNVKAIIHIQFMLSCYTFLDFCCFISAPIQAIDIMSQAYILLLY